jgi:hypothetical protein
LNVGKNAYWRKIMDETSGEKINWINHGGLNAGRINVP